MYQYIKAVALSKSMGAQWEEIDLSQILVYDIFNVYRSVFLVLSNPVLPQPVAIELEQLRTTYSAYTGTIAQMLVDLADRALITTDSIPNTKVKYAKYSDAIRAGYKVEVCKVGLQLPENYPQSELRDLSITRPNYITDLTMIHDYCLVSVNGYYHLTATDNDKAYVYEGGSTLRHSNVNHLGILSFLDIGKVTKVPIQDFMISRIDPNTPLKDRISINVGSPILNKSVILVLGGYLVFMEPDVLWQNGDQTLLLDIQRIPYLERLYESDCFMDISQLNLINSNLKDSLMSVEEVFSDDVLKRYLQLSQSFLAIIDTPYLSTNQIHIRHCSMPGMFTSYQDPTYPLITSFGKVAEYWKTEEDGQWSVTVQDSFYRNFLINHQPNSTYLTSNNHISPVMPYVNSRAYLLEIAGYS